MNQYQRSYPRLSACGLNCGLCPRFHTAGSSRCPGCCGKDFFSKRPSCGVITCSRKKGIEYCYLCEEYPCQKFAGVECTDSFITHKNMFKDFAKAKEIGIFAYQEELNSKIEVLTYLLANCNDGRKKNLYCIAVNLLELDDIKDIIFQIENNKLIELDLKERAKQVAKLIEQKAQEKNISLALNNKKKAT